MPVDLVRAGGWPSLGACVAPPPLDRLVQPNVELDTQLQAALPVSVGAQLQHLQPPKAAGLWWKSAWIFQKCFESLQ